MNNNVYKYIIRCTHQLLSVHTDICPHTSAVCAPCHLSVHILSFHDSRPSPGAFTSLCHIVARQVFWLTVGLQQPSRCFLLRASCLSFFRGDLLSPCCAGHDAEAPVAYRCCSRKRRHTAAGLHGILTRFPFHRPCLPTRVSGRATPLRVQSYIKKTIPPRVWRNSF